VDKKNCWELEKCGRQPGGDKVSELGVCPTALAEKFDGINGGTNAGRYCWAVVGTFSSCESDDQDAALAKRLLNCLTCPFYLRVEKEEERFFVLLVDDYSI
jgi:hypothetical protein